MNRVSATRQGLLPRVEGSPLGSRIRLPNPPKALVDTSVLIGDEPPADVEATISVASLAELHFGVLAATEAGERAPRAQRLATIEATFDPLPLTAEIAREWGRLAAAVQARGSASPTGVRPGHRGYRQREHVPLLTYDTAGFQIISDLTTARQPATAAPV